MGVGWGKVGFRKWVGWGKVGLGNGGGGGGCVGVFSDVTSDVMTADLIRGWGGGLGKVGFRK